jgi:hypothetical protein
MCISSFWSAAIAPLAMVSYFCPAAFALTVSRTVTEVVGTTRSFEWIVTCFAMKPVLPAVSTDTFS